MVFRPDIQKTVYTDYRHSTCLTNKILNLFPTKIISCVTCFRQSCEQCQRNQCFQVYPIQYSLQLKKCHGCNMQLRRWFLTIFSLENERSPVQFVGIMVKYIRNAISMFGKFKTVCLNQAVHFIYCWMWNCVLTPTADVMLKMFAFRNQILFSQVCLIKGSQFSAIGQLSRH